MSTATERAEKIEEIRALPANLQALVGSLTDAQLDAPAPAGEWTVRQVAHHLADSHMNSYIRLKLILTEERPTLKPYNQEAWATMPDSQLPLQATLVLLRGLHQRWVHLFENLSASDWQRVGIHPEIGNITPDDLLTIYARHGQEHLEQIRRLLEGRQVKAS